MTVMFVLYLSLMNVLLTPFLFVSHAKHDLLLINYTHFTGRLEALAICSCDYIWCHTC